MTCIEREKDFTKEEIEATTKAMKYTCNKARHTHCI